MRSLGSMRRFVEEMRAVLAAATVVWLGLSPKVERIRFTSSKDDVIHFIIATPKDDGATSMFAGLLASLHEDASSDDRYEAEPSEVPPVEATLHLVLALSAELPKLEHHPTWW
ncbi:hypothetical protein CRG98_030601 [Punica granatum]|uniref:Uncharacterized protein n=1 Tax=Punica granatum TaxID=22663 RepID=A0A2I0IYF0_PUNGR|nr:hypothetical protein CRG98_030601 [Punica granatum]